MAKYALVNNTTGIVENIVEWVGDTSHWDPPGDTTPVLIEEGVFTDIGYTYNVNDGFQNPNPPAQDELPLEGGGG